MEPKELGKGWPFRYFAWEELACKCGCYRMRLSWEWLWTIESFRHLLGFGMPVNSGYR